jgi:hypothetical protein
MMQLCRSFRLFVALLLRSLKCDKEIEFAPNLNGKAFDPKVFAVEKWENSIRAGSSVDEASQSVITNIIRIYHQPGRSWRECPV